MTVNNNKQLEDFLIATKKHLELVDCNYLVKHLVGKIFHGWIHYRDPAHDWYCKKYYATLDDEAMKILGRPDLSPNPYIYIHSTDIIDYYVYNIIDECREDRRDEAYEAKKDTQILNNKILDWKKHIISKYNRKKHIISILHYNFPLEFLFENNTRIHDFLNINLDINILEFEYLGAIVKLINRNPFEFSLKRISGLWGDLIKYKYYKKEFLADCQNLIIPDSVSVGHSYIVKSRSFRLVEIEKGVFDNLTEVETIHIPRTIRIMDWSFWNCRKLKSISVDPLNNQFKSLDGVLYSKDCKSLLAYPNMHGKSYKVLEGTIIINKFAFKDCDNIEEIELPSTVKQIGINAFYRCTNLKRIICNCAENELRFEGFFGDYGNVNPQWIFID